MGALRSIGIMILFGSVALQVLNYIGIEVMTALILVGVGLAAIDR